MKTKKDKVIEVVINTKQDFYDFMIKHKNINLKKLNIKSDPIHINDIDTLKIFSMYRKTIIIQTFTKKKVNLLINFKDDDSFLSALIHCFGNIVSPKKKPSNLLPNEKELEKFYKYRVEKANKYLAEKRKRVLNKVIAEAIESNEFLAEVDEGFKL